MTFHLLLSSMDNSYWKTSITAYLFLHFPQHLFNLEFNMHWVWNLWLQTWVGKIILFSIMKITLYLSLLSFGYMWLTQVFLRQFMVFLLPLSSWWYLSSGELTKYQGIIGGYFSPCVSFLQNSYRFSVSGPTDNCCLFSVYLFFSPCWSMQDALDSMSQQGGLFGLDFFSQFICFHMNEKVDSPGYPAFPGDSWRLPWVPLSRNIWEPCTGFRCCCNESLQT